MTGKKNLEDGAGAWDMKSLAKKEKGKMENCQCLQEATAQWVTLSPNQLLTRKHTHRYTHRKTECVFTSGPATYLSPNGFARCSGLAEVKFIFHQKTHIPLISLKQMCMFQFLHDKLIYPGSDMFHWEHLCVPERE